MRRPLWDNPRLILLGIAVLGVALGAILTVASRSSASPDFLTEFVLYALSAADLTMLAALVFVLARHVVKLVVERRRGRPFASLRGKLVALAARHDGGASGARPGGRQRDHPHEHGPLVQRARWTRF